MTIKDYCGHDELQLPFTSFEEILLLRQVSRLNTRVEDYLWETVGRSIDWREGVRGHEICERMRYHWSSIFPLEAARVVEDLAYTAEFLSEKNWATSKHYIEPEEILAMQGIHSVVGNTECPISPRVYIARRGVPYFLLDSGAETPTPVPLGPSDLTEEEWAFEVAGRLFFLREERRDGEEDEDGNYVRYWRKYINNPEEKPPTPEQDEDHLAEHYSPDGIK